MGKIQEKVKSEVSSGWAMGAGDGCEDFEGRILDLLDLLLTENTPKVEVLRLVSL